MKKASSSSPTPVCSGLATDPAAVSFRRTAIAVFVAGLLSGCAAISDVPNRIKLDIPGNTSDFRNRLYAGASMGSANMRPDTRGESLSVDSSSDLGSQLRLGYDVHNMLAVEFDTTVLGKSSLSADFAGGPGAEVKYSAATISALVYGWSGVQMRSRREGLSAYGRVGLSSLKKSSTVDSLSDSGMTPVVGLGAEYGFTNGLGIRAEVTRFDGDASYVGFGAVYRFGISPQGIGRMIAEAAEPALGAANPGSHVDGVSSVRETIVERYAGPDARPGNGTAPHLHYSKGAEPDASYVGGMANRWRPAMRSDDTDNDGVLDNADACPDTNKHITVDRFGCGLFDAVLHEVTFKSGSDWLTPRARAQLDLLAETLLAFPESRIQVRAHTDSQGPADMNLGLSARRAEVVSKYLQSRGVHELQLQAVGVGEAQPLDSNKTPEGRRRNRRVDIVTLPDQDAGQLLVAARVESSAVMTVQPTANPHPPVSGVAVGKDDWNTAPRHRRTQSGKALSTSENRGKPGVDEKLSAALPESDSENSRAIAGKRDEAARLAAVMKPLPLPQPGFAPNFPFSGVLTGVKFAEGESALDEESRSALGPLLNALKRESAVRIAVMAHTDNQGGVEANKRLSRQRADAVVDYLVAGGVAADRLKAEGYGELLPLVQNVTDADRARNRRIEVRVLAAAD